MGNILNILLSPLVDAPLGINLEEAYVEIMTLDNEQVRSINVDNIKDESLACSISMIITLRELENKNKIT